MWNTDSHTQNGQQEEEKKVEFQISNTIQIKFGRKEIVYPHNDNLI
jgi:hypothetical protein